MQAPTENEVLRSLRLIDERVASGADRGPLLSLRQRLVGELFGDIELVAETLADRFELVTHASGHRTVTSRDGVINAVARQAEASGFLMWIALDGLVADRKAIAGHGLLHSLRPDQDGVSCTALPIAFFIHFDGELMMSEALYLDIAASRTTTLPASSVPSSAKLREKLARSVSPPFSP